MAMTDYIIGGVPDDAQSSNFTMVGMGNEAQPDIPGLSADEMKSVMDELVRKVLAPAFNAALQEAGANFDTMSSFLGTTRNIVDSVAGALGTDIPSIQAIGALGGGDMTKAVYDVNDNGKVDNADYADAAGSATTATNAAQLGGHASDYYATASALATTSQKAVQNETNIGTINTKITNLTNAGGITKVLVVSSLPASPDGNTLYLVTS